MVRPLLAASQAGEYEADIDMPIDYPEDSKFVMNVGLLTQCVPLTSDPWYRRDWCL